MATRRSEQQAASDRRRAIRVSLKFNRLWDDDILRWLEKQDSKQGAIKDAIRYYIQDKGDRIY